ncbi:DUF6752 domain-containing protein [Arthrobacter sp. Cr_A7]|jgi:hypothetical protein|uniref:DUF6752 domain-containing protein n=1 Tax=Arthrobacter sp. Cr_A7 TaxID=3031017 RepID=UPI0023DB69A1|nr:DUF6752 domain-containing protein [Arthrobacter sp. Cr_A7]MDF2050907.1 hypothetical protein [Arthrobacter sp. Cr_A7]
MKDPLNDPPIEPLEPLDEINLRLAVAAADIAELRAEVARLDRDLDESRRLNLRAAELLDLVYEHLAVKAKPAVVTGAAGQGPAGYPAAPLGATP